jgi:hypothetical protein
MEVVKRNLYSIICGVVAIIAVVLVFYPLGGMFDGLQTRLDESEGDFSSINSLLSKEHTAPDVDLYNAEQRTLDRFPTPKVIQAGEAAVTKVREQSLKLLEQAMQMNKKDPLVREALPAPQGAALSNFKIAYYTRLHDLRKRLNPVSAPIEDDINRRLEALRNEMQQNAGAAGDLGRADFDMELQMKEITIPDEMARERASQGTVYVSPEAGGSGGGGGAAGVSGEAPELLGLKSFDVHHPGVPTPSQLASPTTVDVWAAQLGLWIQEDVVEAIATTNGDARGVQNAVIKRLHEIKVPKEYITKMGRVALTDSSGLAIRTEGYGGGGVVMEDPSMVQAEEGAIPEDPNKPPKDPRASATGRVCNPLYDVVHFHVVVDADAARFREFMARLVSNRHITILAVDLEGVDRDREFQFYYVYGDKPVVRVKLTCEALLFREWTVPLMPEFVKKALKVEPPAGTGAPDPLALR